jgi:hypothetical protein
LTRPRERKKAGVLAQGNVCHTASNRHPNGRKERGHNAKVVELLDLHLVARYLTHFSNIVVKFVQISDMAKKLAELFFMR